MTVNYVASITIDQVIDALQAFIVPLMPAGAQIIRGQVNRVAPPPAPYVELIELLELDLNVPFMDFAETPTNGTANIDASTRIDVQVNFYGQDAGDYAKAFKQAFRSSWGFNQFPDGIKPLYTSDGNQAPLITGEQQYETRWTLTATIQYNPAVTVPQQSATTLKATDHVPVDLT